MYILKGEDTFFLFFFLIQMLYQDLDKCKKNELKRESSEKKQMTRRPTKEKAKEPDQYKKKGEKSQMRKKT